MKKFLLIFLGAALFVMTACANETKPLENGFNLQSAIRAFQKEGIEIDFEKRPLYELVNARDGVIFYYDDEVVRLYEFENETTYQKGIDHLSILQIFPKRELVVIETHSQKAIDLFRSCPE